jgi:NAD(P)-dependent dehydrogenase (short-subunit alcohol dehydrogenase family)
MVAAGREWAGRIRAILASSLAGATCWNRHIASAVAGTGVTVNAVLPGPTRSEALSGWVKAAADSQGITQEAAEQQFLKTMRPTTLINRFTTTDEVANMVVYVCSEQASATTGAALRVDGGVVRFVA